MLQKLLVLILVSISFENTHAFTLVATNATASFQGWASSDIDIYINTANCPANLDIVALSKDAMDFWNNVPTSRLRLKYAGFTTSTTLSSPPIIYCETDFQSVTGADQNSVAGVAAPNSDGKTILSAYIALNVSSGTANINSSDITTLKIILAHEIGHMIGLGHSASESALMYYSVGLKNNVALSQDDIDGVTYLYPNNEFSGGSIAGCGRMKNANLPGPWNGLALVLSLLLPLTVWWGLRRKFHLRRAAVT